MKKRLLSLFLAIIMVLGIIPTSVFAAEMTEPGEAAVPAAELAAGQIGIAKASGTEAGSYLSSLIVKLANRDADVDLLQPGEFAYGFSAPANKSALYVTAALSEDAPEGSTVTATYTKKDGSTANVAVTKANQSLSGCLLLGVAEGHITFTVGAGEDVQVYTLTASRTVALGSAAFKDLEGTALAKYNSQYLVPETMETIHITVNSYGGALTINGQAAVDSEPFAFTPQWDENGECVVTTTSTYNGESVSDSYTLKLYKTADTYTGSCGSKATWSLTGGVLTISGTGTMKAYSSGNRPEWKPFQDAIKSVVIESGITDVSKYAFYKLANLEEVTLADTVKTVGQYAFDGCGKLKKVTMPAVTKIDNYAFRNCAELTEAALPETLKTLGTYVFSGCAKLPAVTIPGALESIGNRAFENCAALKTVEIPATVTSMGTYVFSGCTGLESVTLKGAVGKNMFKGCTGLKEITLDGPTALVDSMFSGCTALESVTIPEGVTAIDDNAFGGCAALTTVSVPGTVTEFSPLAFNGCANLTHITFAGTNYIYKDGIVYSGDGKTLVVALNVEGSVTVPDGVTAIGPNAFDGNTKITGITLPDSITAIGASAFEGCEKLDGVVLPKNVTQIGASAFEKCAALKTIVIPEGITEISKELFRDCAALESVTLPSTLTAVGDSAFYGCGSLKTITIPEGVTKVGASVFITCTSLESVTLPSTLTSIGSTCFSGCSALKSLEIPEKVTKLPQRLVVNCTALETLILPAGLKQIDGNAFDNTTALTLIGFRGSPEQWAAVTRKAEPPIPVVYYYGRTDMAVITEHPADVIVQKDSPKTNALWVTAQPQAQGLPITFTWYRNTEDSNSGGTVVEGTVSDDGLTSYCTPAADTIGTSYYYCVLTTTSDEGSLSVPSETARVDVRSFAWEGNGSVQTPYLLPDAESLQQLYDYVAAGESTEGKNFKVTADITLPEGWKPIGVLIDPSLGHINKGKNMRAFNGVLDGGGFTITVPEGGLPLFGYVQGATVRNLNIYGKKIAGYGLVNNYEGVGLSGSCVVIENVTLKSGTQTLKSGLIGTYITNNGFAGCSGSYVVTIRNCTVEENVVIGYDKDQKQIGSIAGRINGTIENCVSYATVYGTDYVGGILGNRDNAMSTCTVTGCTFNGTVEASGDHAGGIVGGGYDNGSAPNGYHITINDCTASGKITGKDKVGGILGGDSYVVQVWNEYTFKNNSFTGTVSATGGTAVGGIIGYYESLNKLDDITGNYYAKSCGADKGIGFVKYVDTNCATHETESGATYINTETNTNGCPAVSGCTWKAGHNRTDDPLGADAGKLCYTDITPPTAIELQVSGEYKTEYVTGEALDLTGIVLTVVYSDGSTKTITLSEVTVSEFDTQKLGEQKLTITYEGLTATVTVRVKNPEGQIQVTISLLGDANHGGNGTVHTLSGGGLATWVSPVTCSVSSNDTVWDVLKGLLDEKGYRYENPTGNYVQSINGLAEFDNGTNSGWMYTLNGQYTLNGMSQQYLKNGDVIVFHYTDDYTKETGGIGADAEAAEKVEKLIDAIGTVTLDSGDKIAEARKAYDALTENQKKLVGNYDTLTAAEHQLAELKANDADRKKAQEVIGMIDKLDPVTLSAEEAIKAARAAYDQLTNTQKALVNNLTKLEAAEKKLAVLKAQATYEDAYKVTGDHLEKLGTPVVGSVGGEWMVIGLARADRDVPEAYYENVAKYIRENIDKNQRLHRTKSTENSRLILALTAIGKDVTDVEGHNLLVGLNDMDYIRKQGINGPIWALIAFDSHNYDIPAGNVTREALISEILSVQLADGGWALTRSGADPDLTAMAVQALAPYYEKDAKVKAAVDSALNCLSALQTSDGGYLSWGTANSESCAQVLIALTALGIDPQTDGRFIKNGCSVLDGLMAFYTDGGFRHTEDGEKDAMATEQGYLALAAYDRLTRNTTRLYDMSDVKLHTEEKPGEDPTEPTKPNAGAEDPIPPTGDTAIAAVYVCLMTMLLAAFAVAATTKRRKIQR